MNKKCKAEEGKEDKKSECKKSDKHDAMGLTMTDVKPSKTMKFLEHFNKWVEVTSEQETAWGTFSKAIKLQSVNEPYKENATEEMSAIQKAEKQIDWETKMTAMKQDTLSAYKALQTVLDEQQVLLAEIFLAKHAEIHGDMKNLDD